MNKQEIVQKLQEIGLPKEEYWVVAGGAMVLYGIREQTRDIDLGCSKTLADRLEADGYPVERLTDGNRRIAIGKDVELFEGWLYDRIEMWEGLPVISCKGLVMMKESLGREKDLADIAAIKKYMAEQKSD